MIQKKKIFPKEKTVLHPRNKHRERYNFMELILVAPELASFVLINKYGDESIDFFNPKAVMALNKALLKRFYGIQFWDIPVGYLCPPIPSRADYIHYAADLLAINANGVVPKGDKIHCLDVGVGANCIYPIVGHKEYGWAFVGGEIDKTAIASANQIINSNSDLKRNIEIRLQPNPQDIFKGIIKPEDRFDLTICNPPFHTSLKEAQAGTLRKLSNLQHKQISKPELNFGGQNNELWCEGGEEKFIQTMIAQSILFKNSCLWFTTLVAKQVHLDKIYKSLQFAKVEEVKTIPMGQGNKISRIVAWTFINKEQQKEWVDERRK